MSLGIPNRHSLEWVPGDDVDAVCENAVCENPKCDFTGEVEGMRHPSGEYISWGCPVCGREHDDFNF